MGIGGEIHSIIDNLTTITCIFLYQVDVNLNGIIRGTLLAYQFMSKEKGNAGGTIVNIGSLSSSKPFVSSPIYTATKHAILGLTKSYGVSKKNICIKNSSSIVFKNSWSKKKSVLIWVRTRDLLRANKIHVVKQTW